MHPCVKCGACCATYLVMFPRSETNSESFYVPKELTEKVSPDSLALLGTNQPRPRCVALQGKIGHQVGCTIYSRRPGCCREFKPSYEDGTRNPRCDSARRGKGLRALTPRDWVAYRNQGSSDAEV